MTRHNRFIIGNKLNEDSLKAELSIGTVTGEEALSCLNHLFDPSMPIAMSDSAILPAEYADYGDYEDVAKELDEVSASADEMEAEIEKIKDERDKERKAAEDAEEECDAAKAELAKLKDALDHFIDITEDVDAGMSALRNLRAAVQTLKSMITTAKEL